MKKLGIMLLVATMFPVVADADIMYTRLEDANLGQTYGWYSYFFENSSGPPGYKQAIKNVKGSDDVAANKIPSTGALNERSLEFLNDSALVTHSNAIAGGDFSLNELDTEFTVEIVVKPTRSSTFGLYKGPGGDREGQNFHLFPRDGDQDWNAYFRDSNGVKYDFPDPMSNTYLVDQWQAVAVVSNGNTAKLYVDHLEGAGYQLISQLGTSAMSGFSGLADDGVWKHDNPGWFLDEQRMSAVAVAPSNFIMAPEPSTMMLLLSTGLVFLLRRKSA